MTDKLRKLHNSKDLNFTTKEEKQVNKFISKTKTPNKDIDEYGIFNQTLFKVNSFNNSIVNHWISQLNEQQKTLWNELIHTRRITVNYSGVKLDVPRRTLKIKRSDDNTNINDNTDNTGVSSSQMIVSSNENKGNNI